MNHNFYNSWRVNMWEGGVLHTDRHKNNNILHKMRRLVISDNCTDIVEAEVFSLIITQEECCISTLCSLECALSISSVSTTPYSIYSRHIAFRHIHMHQHNTIQPQVSTCQMFIKLPRTRMMAKRLSLPSLSPVWQQVVWLTRWFPCCFCLFIFLFFMNGTWAVYLESNHCHHAAKTNVLNWLPRRLWGQCLHCLRGQRGWHCQDPLS